jgi:large subunit ribosomal protein L14
MIQIGASLNVVDNSGAKTAVCIRVFPNYKHKYAYLGSVVLVSIKSLRSKRRDSLKVKKGELHRALLLHTRFSNFMFSGDSFFSINSPSIILFGKKKKFLATRVFCSLFKGFRFTKFLKILSLCSGIFSS